MYGGAQVASSGSSGVHDLFNDMSRQGDQYHSVPSYQASNPQQPRNPVPAYTQYQGGANQQPQNAPQSTPQHIYAEPRAQINLGNGYSSYERGAPDGTMSPASGPEMGHGSIQQYEKPAPQYPYRPSQPPQYNQLASAAYKAEPSYDVTPSTPSETSFTAAQPMQHGYSSSPAQADQFSYRPAEYQPPQQNNHSQLSGYQHQNQHQNQHQQSDLYKQPHYNQASGAYQQPDRHQQSGAYPQPDYNQPGYYQPPDANQQPNQYHRQPQPPQANVHQPEEMQSRDHFYDGANHQQQQPYIQSNQQTNGYQPHMTPQQREYHQPPHGEFESGGQRQSEPPHQHHMGDGGHAYTPAVQPTSQVYQQAYPYTPSMTSSMSELSELSMPEPKDPQHPRDEWSMRNNSNQPNSPFNADLNKRQNEHNQPSVRQIPVIHADQKTETFGQQIPVLTNPESMSNAPNNQPNVSHQPRARPMDYADHPSAFKPISPDAPQDTNYRVNEPQMHAHENAKAEPQMARPGMNTISSPPPQPSSQSASNPPQPVPPQPSSQPAPNPPPLAPPPPPPPLPALSGSPKPPGAPRSTSGAEQPGFGPTKLEQQLSRMSTDDNPYDYANVSSSPVTSPTYNSPYSTGPPNAPPFSPGVYPGASSPATNPGVSFTQSPLNHQYQPSSPPVQQNEQMPDAVLNMAAKGSPDKKPWSYAPSADVIKQQRDKVRRRTPQSKMPKYQQMMNMPDFSEQPASAHGGPQSPQSPPIAPGPGEATVAHAQYNSPLQMYSDANVAEAFVGQTEGVITDVKRPGGQQKDGKDIVTSPTYRLIHGLDQPKPNFSRMPADVEGPNRQVRTPSADDELKFSGVQRPGDIPSKSFHRLQQMTSHDESLNTNRGGSEIDTTSIRANITGEEPIGEYDEKSIRYKGGSIPSRSFRMLQSMTGGPDSQDAEPEPSRPRPKPMEEPQPEHNPDNTVDLRFVGGNLPSRAFKCLQKQIGEDDQQSAQVEMRAQPNEPRSVQIIPRRVASRPQESDRRNYPSIEYGGVTDF